MTLWEDLQYRGLIKDVSSPLIEKLLNEEKITFYIGTDPTADSMHLGHYSSFLICKRLAKYGHHPILLIGGATGRIGDPKPTSERDMKPIEEILKNVEGLTKQAEQIFGFKVVNNYDWSKDINFIDFLRDYGKYFNVNYMLDKDIIRRRLSSGITYTEFSYMIMQALDFLHLYENENCLMQIAGSDQWGNITAGIDLIKKKTNQEAYGFTMPLITDKDGHKFGKSEGNALWLSKEKTSSYELYQYLINTDDELIIDYLKVFTFLTKEEIEALKKEHFAHPEKRIAQEQLAKEIISDIHSKEDYQRAKEISKSLFTGNVGDLTDKEIEQVFKGMPFYTYHDKEPLIELLVNNKIATSKREAREFLTNNAISLNGQIVNDENLMLNTNRQFNIIRRGKKKYFIFKKES